MGGLLFFYVFLASLGISWVRGWIRMKTVAGPSLAPILLRAKSHNIPWELFVVKGDKLVRNFILQTVKKQQRKLGFSNKGS